MAAMDLYRSFTASLPEAHRRALQDHLRRQREELLAARSEDERTRLVHEYIWEIKELLEPR